MPMLLGFKVKWEEGAGLVRQEVASTALAHRLLVFKMHNCGANVDL